MSNVPDYRERLRLPLWSAIATLGLAGLAAAEIHGGVDGWRAVLPYAVLVPAAAAAVVFFSRHQVRVEAGVLHVPRARAPLSAFGPPVVLVGPALRRQLGAEADVRAFVAVPSFLRSAVLLPVTDPDDGTPYWVIGTRHPDRLARTLAAGATRP